MTIRQIIPEETYALRHAVLWPDKPLDYVMLEEDADGRHFGAFQEDELVAVISLFEESGVARFRKFATRPDCQRQGVGTHLLNRVIDEARKLGVHMLWCDARLSAADFYRRFGMQPEGEVFHKGEIPYSKYVLPLNVSPPTP
ncbi:GNAT family N-acetyltransferase [Larkinella humicola]|uniref:GNAT family N-acetyltransferase n=1 Tax=Larkinella humicola TaxID=2607654 RepID=A0A5N1JKX4_9BACT|nr:GNAT family N-acetyltransferase [Larkinella humicola]KAA9357125.1 GNAT family N-acetyltransferase [Larkinella humicola]